MSAFQEFGFGQNDKGVGVKAEKFKGETGRQYRLSFAWWPEAINDTGFTVSDVKGLSQIEGKTPRFIGGKRYYFEGVGYVMDTSPAFAKMAASPSRVAVATIVVQWPTDADGAPDMGRVKAGDYKVIPWIFSEDKYNAIKPIHREFHLGSHDLNASCTDSKFQKMTFSPCGESLLAKLSANDKDMAKKVVADIATKVAGIAAKLQNEVGREMTPDQVREKLSGGGGGVGSSGNAAAAASSAVTGDLDSLVDDILD